MDTKIRCPTVKVMAFGENPPRGGGWGPPRGGGGGGGSKRAAPRVCLILRVAVLGTVGAGALVALVVAAAVAARERRRRRASAEAEERSLRVSRGGGGRVSGQAPAQGSHAARGGQGPAGEAPFLGGNILRKT